LRPETDHEKGGKGVDHGGLNAVCRRAQEKPRKVADSIEGGRGIVKGTKGGKRGTEMGKGELGWNLCPAVNPTRTRSTKNEKFSQADRRGATVRPSRRFSTKGIFREKGGGFRSLSSVYWTWRPDNTFRILQPCQPYFNGPAALGATS